MGLLGTHGTLVLLQQDESWGSAFVLEFMEVLNAEDHMGPCPESGPYPFPCLFPCPFPFLSF